MTDESLYLTEHGDGSHEAPYGAPRGEFETWEEVEAFLEQVFDELAEDGYDFEKMEYEDGGLPWEVADA
jgi:hypothetical protein